MYKHIYAFKIKRVFVGGAFVFGIRKRGYNGESLSKDVDVTKAWGDYTICVQ